MERTVASPQELGSRLAETRRAAGLSQADLAKKVGLDRTAITKIESGTRGIDALELSRLAMALERPVDWFLLKPPPAVVSRRAALDITTDRPADVLLEQLARDVELLLELGVLSVPPAPRLSARVEKVEEVERITLQVREELGVREGPLSDLSLACERLGLFTASLDLGDESLDGSYVALEQGGVALVNGGAASGRRRFTLAHELGHHLFADSYSEEWIVGEAEEREKLINAFAIHLLLPRASLGEAWSRHGGEREPRQAALILGAEYGVSWTALCAQLRTLGLIDEAQRRGLVEAHPRKADYLELGLRLAEELSPPSLSPGLTRAVIKAYRKHKLTEARALEVLRGTLRPEDLPDEDTVPLEAQTSSLEPLDE